MKKFELYLIGACIGFFIGIIINHFETKRDEKKVEAYIENMNTLIEAIKTGAEPSENGVYEIALSKGEVMLVYPSSDKTRPYVFSTYKIESKPLKMSEKRTVELKEALDNFNFHK